MNTRLSCLALATLFGFVAASAHSATICVNPNKPACEATIQDAVDAASSNDAIQVADGFYNENVVVPVSKPGLTIRGGTGAVLDGDAPLSGVALTVNADGVSLKGFTIRNGQSTAVLMNGARGSIRSLTITGPDSDCIEINGDRTLVRGNHLRGCGSSALLVSADDVHIVRNTISQCDSSCINVFGDAAVIERNKIHITEDSSLIELNGDDAEIVNNSLDNADSEAISSAGDNILISGNKMMDTSGGINHIGQNPRVLRNRGQHFHGKNPNSAGISITCFATCDSGRVSHNRVENLSNDTRGILVFASAAGMLVSNNMIRNAEDVGMDIRGTASITARLNQVMTNGGDSGEHCYNVADTGAHVIERNRGSDCHGDGIHVSGTGHSIRRNNLRDLIEDGINVSAGSNVSITSNNVRGANGVGLELETSTGVTATGNRISEVRLGICDEATSSTLSGNTTANADLPDQLNTAVACPID